MSEEWKPNAPDLTQAMNEAANQNKAADQLKSVDQEKLTDQQRSEVGAAVSKSRDDATAAKARADQGNRTVTAQQIKDLESQRRTPKPEQTLTIGGPVETTVHREVAEKREAEIAAFKEQLRESQERTRDAFDQAR